MAAIIALLREKKIRMEREVTELEERRHRLSEENIMKKPSARSSLVRGVTLEQLDDFEVNEAYEQFMMTLQNRKKARVWKDRLIERLAFEEVRFLIVNINLYLFFYIYCPLWSVLSSFHLLYKQTIYVISVYVSTRLWLWKYIIMYISINSIYYR